MTDPGPAVLPARDRPLPSGPTAGEVPVRLRPPVWRRWAAEHPRLVDGLVAAAVQLIGLPMLVHRADLRPWMWLLDIGLVLPLVWRRRAPVTVFAVLSAAALVQWVVDVRLSADAALLVMLYTVAAYRPRRLAVACAAVLELGALLAALRFSPADGSLASFVFLSGMVAAAFFIGTSVRNRRAYLAALVDRADWLERDREAQSRLAAVAERARIARELHDTVAHSLTVVVTLAEAAGAAAATDPDAARAAMRQVAGTGRSALAEMRRLLGVLRTEDAGSESAPDRAPAPGLDRLDELVSGARAAGLPVRLSVSGRARPLPSTLDVTAYRTVQESLTNALKHAAEPTVVQVSLRWSDRVLAIDVTDDGRPLARREASGGHGLPGMRQRLGVFGGSLTCGPDRAGGWGVHASLPLPEGVP